MGYHPRSGSLTWEEEGEIRVDIVRRSKPKSTYLSLRIFMMKATPVQLCSCGRMNGLRKPGIRCALKFRKTVDPIG
ncbi:hypothetical protein D3C80_1090830 [compost metagenome]